MSLDRLRHIAGGTENHEWNVLDKQAGALGNGSFCDEIPGEEKRVLDQPGESAYAHVHRCNFINVLGFRALG